MALPRRASAPEENRPEPARSAEKGSQERGDTGGAAQRAAPLHQGSGAGGRSPRPVRRLTYRETGNAPRISPPMSNNWTIEITMTAINKRRTQTAPFLTANLAANQAPAIWPAARINPSDQTTWSFKTK